MSSIPYSRVSQKIMSIWSSKRTGFPCTVEFTLWNSTSHVLILEEERVISTNYPLKKVRYSKTWFFGLETTEPCIFESLFLCLNDKRLCKRYSNGILRRRDKRKIPAFLVF